MQDQNQDARMLMMQTVDCVCLEFVNTTQLVRDVQFAYRAQVIHVGTQSFLPPRAPWKPPRGSGLVKLL